MNLSPDCAAGNAVVGLDIVPPSRADFVVDDAVGPDDPVAHVASVDVAVVPPFLVAVAVLDSPAVVAFPVDVPVAPPEFGLLFLALLFLLRR